MRKKGLLFLLLPLLAFTTVHKFYVSVTNIGYSEKDNALQITSRLFIDDMEQVLQERYDIKGNLATEEESELARDYLEKYLRAKFVVEVNGEVRDFTFLAKKYDNDVMVCYLEVPDVELSQTKSIQVQNEILTDLFDEQQNVVHFKINGNKKSFVLIKENNKGMLNL
ncbi:hypothetical protein FK220_015730 [Flavobacteriaceae bacterium TP-CH-4]|uniref:Peptidase E n=1 Tax=Pelagihabitans pacificus TaxID=2696054 RepID=A0A967AX88_9FLAO|nr:DUF6702 family protein [Pelagihabitans pacificus]NHF60805.1 hypothetical protein [Pelagihabitans pacificus]